MGWLVALLVAAVLGGFWWQERSRRTASQREILRLSAELEQLRRGQNAEAANLRSILASMTEGVMLVDGAHIIHLANRSLVDLLELRADPSGQSVLQSVRDISFEEIVTESLASGVPQQAEVLLAHVRPARHLALEATPIRESSGKIAVLVICRDITRLKQLEDVRREFVANVSHELRTPLAIFQGYLENLLDNPDVAREALVEVLEILKRHSTRLNALVEDLLELARLESRAESLRLEPVDPRSLVANVAADWNLHAKAKGIHLSVECDEGAPVFEADAFRVEQVLSNLVENAIKYTDADGIVRLRIAPGPGGVELRVEDTGTGIPPQDLPHIFERFYRADKARTREQGGTGLGLSIVKHIAQLHGGTIRAESTYGKGTTMTVSLPTRVPAPPSAPQPRSEVKAGVNGGEHESEPHLIE